MILKAVFTAVAVSGILTVHLTAGPMDFDLDTSLFGSPPLPGFEDLLLSPAVNPQLSQLDLEVFEWTAAAEPVSSIDWSRAPHSTAVREPLWQAEQDARLDPNVRIATLRLALEGITALLLLALLGLIVSFFTMKDPMRGKRGMWRAHP